MRQEAFKTDRITMNETPESTEVIISGKILPWQFAVLTAWLVTWTIAGFYVISQIFAGVEAGQRIYMYIWLGFWVYFEFKIGMAWIWRKWGREVLIINNEKAILRVDMPVRMRWTEFEPREMSGFKSLEAIKGVFIKNYYESFWVVGGETIGFEHKGKLYGFGRQLPLEESEKLMQFLSYRMRKYTSNASV